MLPVTKLLCEEVAPTEVAALGDDPRRLPPYLLHFARQKRPVVVWSLTRACNLFCIHCYANARQRPLPDELSTGEGKALLEDLASMGVPTVIFSGGEPLLRPDVFHLARYARALGLRTVLSTNGTLIDAATARRIQEAGFHYVGVSLDGLAEVHDRVRGRSGAFKAALDGLLRCRELGVKVGVRFTVHKLNRGDLPGVLDLAGQEGLHRVCIYHLAYAGRGERLRAFALSPQETRQVLDEVFVWAIERHRRGHPVEVLTVDNHADNAYVYLWLKRWAPQRAALAYRLLLWNGGNQSGVAVASVTPQGNVCADQFSWHYSFGNVRRRPFSSIWGEAKEPRLSLLRDRQPHLKGRCRHCRFLALCNGNLRARAERYFGDFLAPDPACYLTDDEIGIRPGTAEAEEAARFPVPVQDRGKMDSARERDC